jgi:nucleotide-binding universal stress UspA family protein
MNDIKDLVAFVDEGGTTVAWAASLAQEHGAHLIGVFLWPPVVTRGADAYVRGGAIPQLLQRYEAQVASLEQRQRGMFERAALHHGLKAEWRAVRHETPEECVAQARHADLALAARPDSEGRGGMPPNLAESLVLAAGRPVLLLPPGIPTRAIRRVLVGWNASREAARAAADAMPFLARAEAVELLVVDPERRSALHGQEPGVDIARHLARHRVAVEVRALASDGEDVGRVLLSRAAVIGADLLVMGAYGHSRLTELAFGGATRTAIREAELPVLMSR